MGATDVRLGVTCPWCGAVRPASPRMAGLAVVCRGCGRPVRVPPVPVDRRPADLVCSEAPAPED